MRIRIWRRRLQVPMRPDEVLSDFSRHMLKTGEEFYVTQRSARRVHYEYDGVFKNIISGGRFRGIQSVFAARLDVHESAGRIDVSWSLSTTLGTLLFFAMWIAVLTALPPLIIRGTIINWAHQSAGVRVAGIVVGASGWLLFVSALFFIVWRSIGEVRALYEPLRLFAASSRFGEPTSARRRRLPRRLSTRKASFGLETYDDSHLDIQRREGKQIVRLPAPPLRSPMVVTQIVGVVFFTFMVLMCVGFLIASIADRKYATTVGCAFLTRRSRNQSAV